MDFGIADDHIAHLSELQDRSVDQFGINPMHDDQDAAPDAYGRDIIPAING